MILQWKLKTKEVEAWFQVAHACLLRVNNNTFKGHAKRTLLLVGCKLQPIMPWDRRGPVPQPGTLAKGGYDAEAEFVEIKPGPTRVLEGHIAEFTIHPDADFSGLKPNRAKEVKE